MCDVCKKEFIEQTSLMKRQAYIVVIDGISEKTFT